MSKPERGVDVTSQRTGELERMKEAVVKRTLNRRTFLGGAAGGAAALAVARFDAMAAAGGAGGSRARIMRQDIEPGGTLTYALSGDLDGHLDPGVTHFDTSIRVSLNI